MVTLSQLQGIALASVLLIVVPGPTVLFVVGRAVRFGRRTALAGIVGSSSGSCVAAACVALGLGPILQRSDQALEVVKLAGAAYLIFLGISALRGAGDDRDPDVAATAVPSTAAAVRTGFMVGMTNPKSFILFAAILPQFVDRSAGAVQTQMLLLGAVPILIGLATDSAWAVVAARIRTSLGSSARRRRAFSRVGATAMIGLGVSIAVD